MFAVFLFIVIFVAECLFIYQPKEDAQTIYPEPTQVKEPSASVVQVPSEGQVPAKEQVPAESPDFYSEVKAMLADCWDAPTTAPATPVVVAESQAQQKQSKSSRQAKKEAADTKTTVAKKTKKTKASTATHATLGTPYCLPEQQDEFAAS